MSCSVRVTSKYVQCLCARHASMFHTCCHRATSVTPRTRQHDMSSLHSLHFIARHDQGEREKRHRLTETRCHEQSDAQGGIPSQKRGEMRGGMFHGMRSVEHGETVRCTVKYVVSYGDGQWMRCEK